MIRITAEVAQAIRVHGENEYPHECCGLLLGRMDLVENKEVVETLPLSNSREVEARHNRFLITPPMLLAGEKQARQKKLDIVGFYHSHPDHPANPSSFDLEHAWPTYSYIIVAVYAKHSKDLRSWTLESDRSRFNAEPIEQGEI